MASDWVAVGTSVGGRDIVVAGSAQFAKIAVPNLRSPVFSYCSLERFGGSVRLEILDFDFGHWQSDGIAACLTNTVSFGSPSGMAKC